jgi:uncharacterized protein (DUF433 family)
MEDLIEINPKVMVGKPVIKGTRITVEQVLQKLAAGESVEDIVKSYPHLNREQVLACLEFAHKSLEADFIFPFANTAA